MARSKDIRVVRWADSELLRDRDVIGYLNLPLDVLALTRSYTQVRIAVPKPLRDEELTMDIIKQYAFEPVTYKIQAVDPRPDYEVIKDSIVE